MEGYKHLASYILATVIYDLTMEFCRIFIRPGSRTRDQMEQAARSGKKIVQALGFLGVFGQFG